MTPDGKSIIETRTLIRIDEEVGAVGRAELLIIAGDSSWRYPLPRAGMVLVGRAPEADLRIDRTPISRRHARIIVTDREVRIEDLQSHNGVRVNGERIEGARLLASGDVVMVGDATLVLRCEQPDDQREILDFGRLRQQLTAEIQRGLDCGRDLSVLVLCHTGMSRVHVTNALADELRHMDVIGWCSSSQVAVLLPELGGEGAIGFGVDICATLASSMPRTSIRGGVAWLRDDGCDADTLLTAARAAAELAEPGQVMAARDAVVTHDLGDRKAVLADPAMLRLYELLRRLARSDLPVLVLGETGTGKENAAAAVHHFSARADRPLVALNCAAIPESLIESELFGHERGAFSGATAAKPGLLERASGGTIFLDEVGELPLGAQAKLLRALEVRRITRLGDVREREVDLRIVAATNRELEDECKAGRFREDLLFRLSVATVRLVPLRQRPREIPVLARLFLGQACSRMGRPIASLSDAVLERLASYEWPGNVRELRNSMEYAAATMAGEMVELRDLPARIGGHLEVVLESRPGDPLSGDAGPGGAVRGGAVPDHAVPGDAGAEDAAPGEAVAGGTSASQGEGASVETWAPEHTVRRFRPLTDEVRELERTRMIEALEATGGVQKHAAALIGMPARTFAF
ncbi:MAG TPA: sigma 54-interacting transcriptional regulator, partial [Haliangium sp.]|nr:sigma 54-interacting transcriptional regulator [Haliangium sp.]